MKKTKVVKIRVDGEAEGKGPRIRRVDFDKKELDQRGPSWTNTDRNKDPVLHMRIESSLGASGIRYCY